MMFTTTTGPRSVTSSVNRLLSSGMTLDQIRTDSGLDVTADGALWMVPDADAQSAFNRYSRDIATAPATPSPARDRSADRVARMVGLGYGPATGQCHYCGGNLTRSGYCTECR